MSVSRDVQYMKLTNDLRDLKAKREKVRPMLYWLLMIVLVFVGLFLPGWLAFLAWGVALASLLAGLTAHSNLGTLDKQVSELERQIRALEAPPASPPA